MYFVHTPFSYDLFVVPSSSQASPLPELLLTELLEFVCVPLLLATATELELGTTPELPLVTSPLLRGSAAPLDEFVCSPPLLEVTATLPEESSV